jgi:hypothetical protein
MIGDSDYQLTDLVARVKVLENKTRAVNPGNAPSRGPDHPLRPLTSTGQIVHGSDSDMSSRITAALQEGLAGLESIQDVNRAVRTINFGGGATQHLFDTNYVRPDPIVGDTFRMMAGGYFLNSTGGAQNVSLGWSLGGGTSLGSSNVSLATGNYIAWWWLLLAMVTAAGSSGTYVVNGRQSWGTADTLIIGGQVTKDLIVSGSVSANLVAPVATLFAFGGASASLQVTLNQYSLERLGAQFASKV